MSAEPSPAPETSADLVPQAEPDNGHKCACACGGKCQGQGGGMTLADALARLERLRENIVGAEHLVRSIKYSDDIKALVASALDGWKQELAQLESAKVQVPA